MSMLEKILEDGVIEPELLAELADEQKQILFCKMRERQLDKWSQYERDMNEKELDENYHQRKPGPRVQFLLGRDGEPWVWIMGEHLDDKSIDQIMEDETHRKAKELAEVEMEKLRKQQEEELKDKLRLEGLEADREKSAKSNQSASTANGSSGVDSTSLSEEETEAWKMFQHIKEARAAAERLEIENKRRKEAEVAQERLNREMEEQRIREEEIRSEKLELEARLKAKAERQLEEEKSKRESQIYEAMRDAREKQSKEAEAQQQLQDKVWEEQEKKSKQAEEQIREIARRAREQHRSHSLRTSSSFLPLQDRENIVNSHKSQSMRLPRPSKPKSRSAIVDWFVREERFRGIAQDPNTGDIALWFHGIIPRSDAEDMLQSRPIGHFLIRVSERIWGYALSYKADDKVKHFLIERIPTGYQFLGTNQIVHLSLWELVIYHQKFPITERDKEILVEPVGQTANPPDYFELFASNLYSSEC